jgi:hypothetical protein
MAELGTLQHSYAPQIGPVAHIRKETHANSVRAVSVDVTELLSAHAIVGARSIVGFKSPTGNVRAELRLDGTGYVRDIPV